MRVPHLVLEDDVHKALWAHKRRTGATVRAIGNAALRAALALPSPAELVVRKLAHQGKLSPKECAQAVAEAERELNAILSRLARDVSPHPGRTRRVGSWEGKLLCTAADGACQIVLWWARDGKKAASPPHCHSKSHEWQYVLRGRVAGRIGEKTVVLGAHESAYVPPGVPHLSAPLTQDTAMIVVLSPPEKGLEENPKRKAPPRAQQLTRGVHKSKAL